VIQDTLKIEQKYFTVQRAQERLSERTSERSGAREQCGASERLSGASERASGRSSGPLLTSRSQGALNRCEMEILSVVNKKKNVGGDEKMKKEIHTRKGKKRWL